MNTQNLSSHESNPVKRTALYGIAILAASAYFTLAVAAFAMPFVLVFYAVSHWK